MARYLSRRIIEKIFEYKETKVKISISNEIEIEFFFFVLLSDHKINFNAGKKQTCLIYQS